MMNFFGKQTSKNSKSGFTLVEVMIVLAVIALMAGAAVPALMTMLPNYRIKVAARDLYANFQLAKIQAIKRNEPVVIAFNVAAGRYQVFVDDGGPTPVNADNDILDAGEPLLLTATMPPGVTLVSVNFSLGSMTPGFLNNGLPLANRIGNVLFNNVNGVWYRLTLSAAGAIRLASSHDSTDGVNGNWGY